MAAEAMAGPFNDDTTLVDDRPVAVRRKRRASSVNGDAVHQVRQQLNGTANHAPSSSETPSKPKKKVRFSEPGPDSPMTRGPAASTGLTPHLSRSSIESRARDARDSSPPLRPQASRRLSLPPSLSISLPSPSRSIPPTSASPMSGEVQFAPLRQIVDPRSKRRMRRNHLSEEMNEIQAEHKTERQLRRELEKVTDELAREKQKKESVDPLSGHEASARIQELEHELAELKQENSQVPTPLAEIPFADSSGIFIDDTAVQFEETEVEDGSALRDRTPAAEEPRMIDMAAQASLGFAIDEKVLRDARMALEYLFPGENTLGLVPDDPKLLFDTMLERIQTLKTEVLVAQDSLSTTQTSESNMRTQFNAVLEQLERSRKYAERVAAKHTSEKARADSMHTQFQTFEQHASVSGKEMESLKKDCKDKERSIRKLNKALDSYRIEVGKLEELVNRMETDHNEELLALRGEMDEAVADLECHVAAETLGRQEAERQVVERDARIVELQSYQQRFEAVVHEKESEIEKLRNDVHSERTDRELAVGGLNTQINTLTSQLEEAKGQRNKAERACDDVLQKLEAEKEAGKRAVAAVQAEIDFCVSKAEGIKVAHESDAQQRSAEVDQYKGLLTPISGTRFKDVYDGEGYIIAGRGSTSEGGGKVLMKRKRRPDSGIGILEEDANEDFEGFEDLVDVQ